MDITDMYDFNPLKAARQVFISQLQPVHMIIVLIAESIDAGAQQCTASCQSQPAQECRPGNAICDVCEIGTDGLLNNLPISHITPLLISSTRKKMEAISLAKKQPTIMAKM